MNYGFLLVVVNHKKHFQLVWKISQVKNVQDENFKHSSVSLAILWIPEILGGKMVALLYSLARMNILQRDPLSYHLLWHMLAISSSKELILFY